MSTRIEAIRVVLDRAADLGRSVELWWRDDDATEATPALGRLLRLSDAVEWPVGIAAIPTRIRPDLLESLVAAGGDHRILVHGLSHANHAPPSDKKAEFGPHRALARLESDAREALALVTAAFGAAALPVFVPPWNRIDLGLASLLRSLGYSGLSGFGERRSAEDGLVRADVHLDPVDWRGGRGVLPVGAIATQLRTALERGTSRIGLLTHHLAFTPELWALTEAMTEMLARHPAVSLVSPATAFAAGDAAARDPAARDPAASNLAATNLAARDLASRGSGSNRRRDRELTTGLLRTVDA